jgi:predicted MFS family arabinose efflux permease
MTAETGRRIRGALLPPTSSGRRLLVAYLVDTLGTGLFLAGSMVFFTRSVGLSVVQVGTGLSLAGLIGMLASVPLGILADRVGVRRVLVAVHLCRAAGFGLYVLCTDFSEFLVVACLIGVADRTSSSLNQALVSMAVSTEDRVRTMGLLRVVGNVSFTVGGLLTALVLSIGNPQVYPMLVLANAVSFVVVAGVVGRLPLRAPDEVRTRTGPRLLALRDRRWVSLAAVNCLLCFYHSLLVVGIPLFALEYTDAPISLVAFLFVVNTVVVVAAQVRVTRVTDRPGGAARAFRWAGLALAATCLLVVAAPELTSAGAIAVLTAAVVALTAGEMLQSAAAWDVTFSMAETGRQSEYLAVFNLGAALERIAGPVAVAGLLLGGGWPLWVATAGIFVAAGLVASRLATPGERAR